MSLETPVIEVIPNLFYWKCESQVTPKNQTFIEFFHDRYWLYCSKLGEQGSYSIDRIHDYCKNLEEKLEKAKKMNKKLIHVSTYRVDLMKRVKRKFDDKTNSIILVCAYLVICKGEDPYQAIRRFDGLELNKYHDFSKSKVRLEAIDFLVGLAEGIKRGWYNYKTFNQDEYERFNEYTGGDINWIIPNEIAGFSGPSDLVCSSQKKKVNTSSTILQTFKRLGIRSVVRLNEKEYDASVFTSNGIQHFDYEYEDGSVPPEDIFIRCMKTVMKGQKPIAIHCKAGVGRTGTIIGSYLILKYKMKALTAMAWMRLNRPGMVSTFQQDFLVGVERDNIGDKESQNADRGDFGRKTPSGDNYSTTPQNTRPTSVKRDERLSNFDQRPTQTSSTLSNFDSRTSLMGHHLSNRNIELFGDRGPTNQNEKINSLNFDLQINRYETKNENIFENNGQNISPVKKGIQRTIFEQNHIFRRKPTNQINLNKITDSTPTNSIGRIKNMNILSVKNIGHISKQLGSTKNVDPKLRHFFEKKLNLNEESNKLRNKVPHSTNVSLTGPVSQLNKTVLDSTFEFTNRSIPNRASVEPSRANMISHEMRQSVQPTLTNLSRQKSPNLSRIQPKKPNQTQFYEAPSPPPSNRHIEINDLTKNSDRKIYFEEKNMIGFSTTSQKQSINGDSKSPVPNRFSLIQKKEKPLKQASNQNSVEMHRFDTNSSNKNSQIYSNGNLRAPVYSSSLLKPRISSSNTNSNFGFSENKFCNLSASRQTEFHNNQKSNQGNILTLNWFNRDARDSNRNYYNNRPVRYTESGVENRSK